MRSERWVPLVFEARQEAAPGPAFQQVFEAKWPAYREWFVKEGDAARPSYAEGIRALRLHMPEIVPTYDRLVELAGGGDLAARFLSMWDPPPYLSACSQAAWTRNAPPDGPMLVRNYDYAPDRFEGVVWSTAWNGRRVLGTSDCAWGLLDGMNDDGLAISLAFGGRQVVGQGFGIPLVLRYLLETCADVAEARAALQRVPVNLAHNLTFVDAHGASGTAFVGPDHEPRFVDVACTTNHQDVVEWPELAQATRTVERQDTMVSLLDHPETTAASFAEAFLRPPLHSGAGGAMVTLYTAAYHPTEGHVRYVWPGSSWERSFDDQGGTHRALIPAAARVAT
jgi:predicted choloylglycine hydrolase